jgi:hypothetical protein
VPVQVPGAFAYCEIGCGVVVIGGVNVTGPTNSQLPSKLAGWWWRVLADAPAGTASATTTAMSIPVALT